MLAPAAPFPPNHGAAQRNLNLLEWLARDHDVILAAFGDPSDARAREALGAFARRVEIVAPPGRTPARRLATLLTSRTPDLAARLASPRMVDRLRAILRAERVDLVQVEGLEMIGIWDAAEKGHEGRLKPIVVFDEHNAEYLLQRSAALGSVRQGDVVGGLYSLVQWQRLRRFEAAACRRADGVVAVSEPDAAALRALAPGAPVVVVPNGVDTTFYRPRARSDGRTVLFIGKLDYRPNVDAVLWLARAIWPAVRRRVPNARLVIAGRDPVESIARLGTPAGIEVVGPVEDDRACFEQAAVFAVPMRMGSGVRLKVLQALAMEVPIVSTTLGMAGVGAADGIHFLHADTADAFATRIARLLGDPAERLRIAAAGRAFVEERFDWQVICPKLDELYTRLARGAPGRS